MLKKNIKAILANQHLSELDKLEKILVAVTIMMGLPSKDYINMETKEIKGKKILWVEIKSSIYTFLAVESTFIKINNFTNKSGADIDRVVITTRDKTTWKKKGPVKFSWAINKNDRRSKVIHSRHYTSFCAYLWWDSYIPKFLGKMSDKQKTDLKKVFYDQSIQDQFIIQSLKELKREDYLVESSESVEATLTKIKEEWAQRNKGGALDNPILYRFKAMEIGIELELFKAGEKRNLLIFSGSSSNSVERYIEFIEELEHMAAGSIESESRRKDIVMRRHLLMCILRKSTPYSLKAIGKKIGGRHHTTVMHGIRRIEDKIKTSPVLKAVLEQLCILFDNIRIYNSVIYSH